VLVDDTDGLMRYGCILELVRHGLRLRVLDRMVEARGVLVGCLGRIKRALLGRVGEKLLVLEGQLLSEAVRDLRSLELRL
jgi:hypothetical protein